MPCAAQWNDSLGISEDLYRYYQGRAHQSDDMVQFVLSDYDRVPIRNMAESFHGDLDHVIDYVQSLRYVTDRDSKGEDDYVRFPVETMVDGEGDCEDLAILAAAILYEMGYEVLLVMLPDHMALAVHSDDKVEGTYYDYEGARYFYLEVTHAGWSLGQIPEEFKNCQATLVPLVYRPRLRLPQCSYHHDTYYSSDKEVLFMVHCELENLGPGTTEGLEARVSFVRPNGTLWVERVFHFDELNEGEAMTYELNVSVPRPFHGKLYVRAEGANFGTETIEFKDIDLP